MNEWSKRTLDIIRKTDYLDKLQGIYPHDQGEREVDGKVIASIRESFRRHDCASLLNRLLDLKKFPYKDSYVAFLRKDRDAIKRNPKTVERICNNLYDMGVEKVIEGVIQPKEANTSRGQQFSRWIRTNFEWVDVGTFKKSGKGIVMLDASEKEARDFCNKEMGVGISKRPDIVAKSGSK